MLHTFDLLTIDLSMFGDAGAAPAGGEGSAPAAAEAPAAAPEVRYGKQPEQTAAPQQETSNPTPETPPDKNKLFSDLIKGEYKDQYTEATQKLIDRRFKGLNEVIASQKPIIDFLAVKYKIDSNKPAEIMDALRNDRAMWEAYAESKGMTVEQSMDDFAVRSENQRLIEQQRMRDYYYNEQRRNAEEAEIKKVIPEFDRHEARNNPVFATLLDNGFTMMDAFKAAFSDQIAAVSAKQAAASAEKAVTDNIKARGARPAEAGANPAPAFAVKDDVNNLSKEDVLAILGQISENRRISFG